ncbi:hypothetical protein [Actinophytocola sediminis]
MNERGTVTTRWWLAAAGLAALLIVAAGLGVLRPGGFVVLGWLDRPFLFGTVAAVLLALAGWLALRDPVRRLVVTCLLVVFAIGWAGLGWFAVALRADLAELSRHRSPDGSGELRVYRGSNVIDPTWELRLRSGSGFTAREWDLGCVNSDQETLTGVAWTGPDGLRVRLERHGPVEIALDASTGRPARQLSIGC